MELKEFIEDVFTNLIDGVKASQEYAAKNNAIVAPHIKSTNTLKGDKVMVTYLPKSNNVEFEVVLTQIENANKKVGIGVFLNVVGVGEKNENRTENQINTKIKFSIPFVFPIQES